MATIISRVLDTALALLDLGVLCRPSSTERRMRPVYAGSQTLWQAPLAADPQCILVLFEHVRLCRKRSVAHLSFCAITFHNSLESAGEEGIAKHFRKKLGAARIIGIAGIEAGFAWIGLRPAWRRLWNRLSVAAAQNKNFAHVRVLKLDDFVPVVVGAIGRIKLTARWKTFLEELHCRAQQLLAEFAELKGGMKLIE